MPFGLLQEPEARLGAIRAAGEARVPFTSGLLIGIGETRVERIEALLKLREIHAEYGHIEVRKRLLAAASVEPFWHDFCTFPQNQCGAQNLLVTRQLLSILRLEASSGTFPFTFALPSSIDGIGSASHMG